MRFKLIFSSVVFSAILSGCASVSTYGDAERMEALQSSPADGLARIYVYRDNTTFGAALKKDVYVDGKCVGESAKGVFFYTDVTGNCEHKVATESEFSPNVLTLYTEANKKYYVRQYIKFGVFVGGAGIEQVDEQKALESIENCQLAVPGTCGSIYSE